MRQLRKSRGFTVTAVIVLGLSIAAATAIFAFVDATFLRPLPYRDPAHLVALYERIPVGDRYHLSYGDYLDWKRFNRSFTSLGVYRPDRFRLKTAAGGEEVSGAKVSDGFFKTLGVVPLLGRDFRPGEELKSAPETVILSYEVWQTRFAGSPDALGQTVILDDQPFVIVGVLPPVYHFAPVANAGFWTTLHWNTEDGLRLGAPYYGVARLKPGVSMAASYDDLSAIARQIALAYPNSNRDRTPTVIPLANAIYGDVRPTLAALLAAAALLALIGFTNVASLLLVRAESRRRETAVRGALGASRARLVRQFAVEGFLLAGAGALLGLMLTSGAISLLLREIPRVALENMPYLHGLSLNTHVIGCAAALSLLGGALFSMCPAVQLWGSSQRLMEGGLREGGRAATGRSWRQAGAGLVICELAITVVLLVSAGLLSKSLYRLLHEDVGIAADHLAVLHVVDPDASTDAQSLASEHQIRRALAALPGALSAADSEELPFDTGEGYAHLFAHFRVVGRAYTAQGDEAGERAVSVGYFETVRARLLEGRYFTEAEDPSQPRVALINRTMAGEVFPGEDPLGKIIVNEFNTGHPERIIGVIEDIKEGPLDAHPNAAVYDAINQNPTNNFYVTLRAAGSPAALLPIMVGTIHRLGSGFIVNGQETMTDRINNSQAAYLHRSAAWLVAAFAALALLLGTVGLYGVISYSVGRRTREIGVRMALGAQRSSVYRLVLKEACWLAALGITSGLLCALVAGKLLQHMLYGVSPSDTSTLLSVVGVLAAATLLAGFLPSRRAASIDPTQALRAD